MTREWFEKVAYHSLGWRTSQEMTYDIAQLAIYRNIPGDFVECGVYAGASCALMAMAIMEEYPTRRHPSWGADRRVHLFDSFAGIPPPGPHDAELQANRGGESACSLVQVKANMREWGIPDELLVWHPGLFSETVPCFAGQSLGKPSIAVLRLDGDLYDSTRVCMEHLYPLVSPGGYAIIDDFHLSGCRKAVLEAVSPAPIYWRKEPA